MIFLESLEIAVYVLLIAAFITQILLPCIKGTPLFPAFRRRPNRVAREMESAAEEFDLADKEKRAKALREAAERIRSPQNQQQPDQPSDQP